MHPNTPSPQIAPVSSVEKSPSGRNRFTKQAVALTAPLFAMALAGLLSAQPAAQPAAPSTAPQAAPTEGKDQPAATTPGRGGRGGRGGGRGPAVKAGSVTFNTVITKLKEGKQIFSNTISDPDLEAAKRACEGVDFVWIEMQHAPLTWREMQQLIKVIAEAGSIPFVRVPTATESDIQKATDAGALGIIVPMVDSVEEARNAVLFAKWPIGHRDNPNAKPWGHRSSGGGQAGSLWGPAYQTNANNNIMIMIQIENPAGVGLIDTILDEVEGIDIVMVASNDFGWQAGDRDGDASYNAREKLVRESVLAHGKILAGPSSWQTRPGYRLFQGRRSATNTGYDANGALITTPPTTTPPPATPPTK
jgi:4-hydroxy-2-oxoheptanedioate aldolase